MKLRNAVNRLTILVLSIISVISTSLAVFSFSKLKIIESIYDDQLETAYSISDERWKHLLYLDEKVKQLRRKNEGYERFIASTRQTQKYEMQLKALLRERNRKYGLTGKRLEVAEYGTHSL